MHVLKRFLRGFSSQFFKFCIVVLAMSAAIIAMFGTSAHLKATLKNSGVYDHVVESALEETQKEQHKKSDDEIPVDDPAVKGAIKSAFSTSFIENTSNTVIDSVYAWLEGDTMSPQFTIDLTDVKHRLATAVGDVAVARVKKLPTCTQPQLLALDPNDIDPFKITCKPPGINLTAERTKLVNQIENNKDFLEDTTITNKNLDNKEGQNVFDKAAAAPTAFQWANRLPWLLGSLAVLAAGSLIFLHDDRRRGIWVVGRALLVTGLVLLIASLIILYLSRNANFVKIDDTNQIQQTLLGVARSLVGSAGRVFLVFGIVYSAIGGGTMLAIRLTRPKPISITDRGTPIDKEAPSSEAETKEQASKTTKAEAEKPAKKDDKIQG